MNAGAIVMFVIGAVGLWGGLAVAVWNYLRKAARDTDDDYATARSAGEAG